MNINPADIWRRIAPWWDAAIGEGNDFQLQLIMPATDRLLSIRPCQRVLDLACGNGNYSRRLARAGARVVAVDVAEGFIDAARLRTKTAEGDIDFRVGDLTDQAVVNRLGQPGEFDAAVCSMALMDLPTLDPLAKGLALLLKPNARFVFSLPHPCFNSTRSRMTADLVNEQGKLEQIYGVAIRSYIKEETDLSSGILNQPEPHYLYHRPLSVLINTFFRCGFMLDALEEPVFPAGASGGKNAFSWKARPEIPPALVARLIRTVT